MFSLIFDLLFVQFIFGCAGINKQHLFIDEEYYNMHVAYRNQLCTLFIHQYQIICVIQEVDLLAIEFKTSIAYVKWHCGSEIWYCNFQNAIFILSDNLHNFPNPYNWSSNFVSMNHSSESNRRYKYSSKCVTALIDNVHTQKPSSM